MQETTVKIPAYKLGSLKAEIAKMNRKAAKRVGSDPIILEARDADPVKVTHPETGREYRVPMCEVTIRGSLPVINGWTAVAAFSHKQEGTLVFGEKVPRQFWDVSPERCDHCERRIRRNTTFLLKNGKRYKVVGSTCLKDFTGVSVDQFLAAYRSVTRAVKSMLEDEDLMAGFGYARNPYLPTEELLAIAAVIVRASGFQPSASTFPTRDDVLKVWSGDAQHVTIGKESKPSSWWREEIATYGLPRAARVLAWLKKKSKVKEPTQYMNNLCVVALDPIGVHKSNVGLVVSAIPAFDREREARSKARKTKDAHRPEKPGTRVEETVKVVKSITLGGDWGPPSYLHVMLDAQKRTLVWYASNPPSETGLHIGGTYKVRMTIKDRKDRFDRGLQTTVKETRVNRVALLGVVSPPPAA